MNGSQDLLGCHSLCQGTRLSSELQDEHTYADPQPLNLER
jgi:hypothetical protein